MSYPKDLDEYTDAQLREELARREQARAEGRCDYCGRGNAASACRFPNRHALGDSGRPVLPFIRRFMLVL